MVSKKLHSDFKFGFEFEGFAKIEKFLGNISNYDYSFNSWDNLECNNLYESDTRNLYENVNSFINEAFKSSKGRTHYDGSVKGYLNGYQSFEYSSPVFKFTPKNIKMIKDFFNNMEVNGFGINGTCGFHTHISFPQMSEKDAIWIVSQIAIDEVKSNEFCYFKYNDDSIDFYSERYASKSYLESIRKSIKEGNYSMVSSLINSDKYRVLRIHPQGTLEWRGPRNFLNLNNGINLYINKLSKIIDILSSSLNEKEINGLSKDEFFKLINKKDIYYDGLTFPSNCKFIMRKNMTGLIDKFGNNRREYNFSHIGEKLALSISKNPKNILNKDYVPFFNTIFNKLKYMNKFSETIDFILQNENNINIPFEIKLKLIRNMPSYISILNKDEFKYLEPVDIFNWMESIHISYDYNESSAKSIEYVLSNIDKDLLLNCALSFISNADWTIIPIMNLIEQGVFKNTNIKNIYMRYCNCYTIASSHNNIGSFVYTPEELHKKLKNYMEKGLINNIVNDTQFGETYTPETSDFSSFFVIDSLRTKLNSISAPLFELVCNDEENITREMEAIEEFTEDEISDNRNWISYTNDIAYTTTCSN